MKAFLFTLIFILTLSALVGWSIRDHAQAMAECQKHMSKDECEYALR